MNNKYELGMRMYLENNKSLTQISKEIHVSRGRLAQYIKNAGCKVINKQNESDDIVSDIFENINTEEKAYWLGFLYADGYISKNTNNVELALQEKDKEHLEKFKKFLNTKNKICYRPKTNSYRIMINNKQLHESLVKQGCFNCKSLTMKFPTENQVPSYLLKHFVRGYVDGDGYVGITYYNSEDEKTKHGRLSLTCGSEQFILEIIKSMNWEPKKIKKDKRSNALTVEWNNYNVYYKLKTLYEDANIYLTRKYQKFIELHNAVLNQKS